METPLTPLEFARRARKLYGGREAVVDGDLRLTYEQFLDRCDRWSTALQGMGVRKGDRVAYIAPNTHEQLESFYAVPQIGAVLVPINYRLTAEDFVYITGHSGAKVLCVHPDYLDAVDGVRDQLRSIEHFVSLGPAGGRKGWSEYEPALARSKPDFVRPDIAETDLLALNYTSGTTAKPKGVMITHRNAWANIVGTLVHFHITVGDRYLWTLPMFHANGWTFVWIITAVGGTHICLPKVEPARVFDLIRKEKVGWLCAAPTILIALANASEEVRGDVPKGVQVITAGAAIMITVFLSFVLGDAVLGKMFGIGLAAAILIDATIVRMVLVPATMELLGDRNWWFPRWLDRLIPRLHVEAGPDVDAEFARLAEEERTAVQ